MKTYKVGLFYANGHWYAQVTVTDQAGDESYAKAIASTATGALAALVTKMKEQHLG